MGRRKRPEAPERGFSAATPSLPPAKPRRWLLYLASALEILWLTVLIVLAVRA